MPIFPSKRSLILRVLKPQTTWSAEIETGSSRVVSVPPGDTVVITRVATAPAQDTAVGGISVRCVITGKEVPLAVVSGEGGCEDVCFVIPKGCNSELRVDWLEKLHAPVVVTIFGYVVVSPPVLALPPAKRARVEEAGRGSCTPAQGERAPAAVGPVVVEEEEEEEEENALEAEKVALQEQIALLKEQIVAAKTALQTELRKTAKSANELSNAVRFGMVLDNETRLATAIRDTLEELEENLKPVKEELLQVRKQQTLAMEQGKRAQKETSEARVKRLARRFEFKFWVNETQERPAYRGAEEAKAAVEPYIKGALGIGTEDDDKVAWNRVNNKNLVRIFAMIGQMGKGKTRFQYELCRQSAGRTRVSEAEAIEMDFGTTHINFVRLTYIEGFSAFPGVSPTTFGRNLLVFNGMKRADARRVRSLKEAIKLLYSKLSWPSEKRALVVCVDEFFNLPLGESTAAARPDALGILMRELVVFQQASCETPANRVVFLFAAVTEAMMLSATKTSGRETCENDVPTLGKNDALHMLFELRGDLRDRYETDPQFEQLVHLCLPRPRALFIGLLHAYPVGAKSVIMAVALTEVAKSNSVHEALRHLTENEVRSWLAFKSLPGDDERKELQKQWGVTAADGNVDPLTLRYWCEVWSHETWKGFRKVKKILPVACYLREAYLADTQVNKSYAKVVEEVLFNFEAAKRASYDRPFTLSEYYKGGTIKAELAGASVCAFPHSVPEDFVKTVATFKDAKRRKKYKNRTFKSLKKGCVVVSAAATEKAIEYLVPFFSPASRRLKYVAAIQVKFSPKSSIGGGYNNICKEAMKLPIVKYLQRKNVTCFPVLFSTSHDSTESQVGRVNDGVLYNEAAMLEFTKCLGPLRLHRELVRGNEAEGERSQSVADTEAPKAKKARTE